MTGPLNLDRTRTALAEYDVGTPMRLEAWGEALTIAQMEACQTADHNALVAVREAFALDSADRNSRERAMLIDVATLRRWCAERAP